MSEVLSATNLKFLAQGMWTTLYLSFFIIVLSTLFGTILAVMRNGKNPILRWIASIYIEFVRNVPNLLWIFIIFLVFQLKSTAAGITSFTVFTSAALAEIIRGGLNSIDHGQTEAGLSQGFTYADTMRIIILPQAVRTILPPLTNQVVNLIKNTSTVAIISGADIMFTAKAWAYDTTNYVPAFAGAAFLYFIMCFPLATWARRKEEENKKAY